MSLFSSPKIDGAELQDCLTYFEKQTQIIAFQTKEADLYNDVMAKYQNAMLNNTQALSQISKAVKRLSLSADEIIKRYDNLQKVPSVASKTHQAWYSTFTANKAWASATAAAIDSFSKGSNPDFNHLHYLASEMQKYWKEAEKQDKNFLKQLKINPDELAQIVHRANALGAKDDWEPDGQYFTSSADSVNEINPIETSNREPEIILLKDDEWSLIDGSISRVTSFNPLGAFKDEKGNIQATSNTTPYAAVMIDNLKLGNNITGYITHKIDFGNLWEAFNERTVKENEEVLIIWTRKNYKSSFKAFSTIMPKLIIMICNEGTFERIGQHDNGIIFTLPISQIPIEIDAYKYWKPEAMI